VSGKVSAQRITQRSSRATKAPLKSNDAQVYENIITSTGYEKSRINKRMGVATMKKRILSILLAISLIVSATVPAVTSAAPKVLQQVHPANLQVSKTANNNYILQVGNHSMPL